MEKPELRKAAVAGHFYPAHARELAEQVDSFLDLKAAKSAALACILPHAGYIYSGKVAGAVVSRLEPRQKIFLLGPNHTGYGTPFSVMSSGRWQTPLGEVPVDERLARSLVGASDIFKDDELAHLQEHSLEVELPFFQRAGWVFSIIPVAIASDSLKLFKEAGKAIAGLFTSFNLKGKALICASSDMTHYEPHEEARRKDHYAIEAVLALDEDALLQRVKQTGITMCGYAPVCVMIAAAKALGAKSGELVKYMTSGDSSGDFSSVVGYAGIIIT